MPLPPPSPQDDGCLHSVNPIERVAVLDPQKQTLSPLDDPFVYGGQGPLHNFGIKGFSL